MGWYQNERVKDSGDVVPAWAHFQATIRHVILAADERKGRHSPCEATPYVDV